MAMAPVAVVGERDKFTKRFDHLSWVSDKPILSENGDLSMVGAPLVQWMVDRQGVFILSEGEGLATLGLAPGEVVGKSVFDVYADVPPILENVRNALRGQTIESTVEFANMVWECRYYPIWNPGDEIFGVVGTAFNITEQRKRLQMQEVLVNFASALRRASTRAEMPSIILDRLSTILKAENTALITHNPQNGTLTIELSRGDWGVVDNTALSAEVQTRLTRNSKKIIAEGLPFLDNEFSLAADFDGILSVAGVPLTTQEDDVGVLWIGRMSPFTDDEVLLLLAVGEMIANALRRAAQHEKTERRLKHISALHAIDQAITGSLDLRVTLSILLDQVVKQLDIDAVDVFLHEPQLQRLKYYDGRGFMHANNRDVSLRLGEGLAGCVALSRQPICIAGLSRMESSIAENSYIKGENFVVYYGVPLIAKGKLKGVLEIFHRKPLNVETEWVDFLKALATQAAIAIYITEMFDDIQRSNVELDMAYIATLEGWVRALDLRDRAAEGRTQNVTRKTVQLARAMGVSEKDLVHVRRGALLHDIGKIGVPDHILNKSGPLTKKEWELMRMHPLYAYDMLNQIEFLRPALDIPYCHHEKWNGAGYPQGLKAEQIPLAARIFSVIDVWDALNSDRPYRKAWPPKAIHEYVVGQAGECFDPKVVDTWLRVFDVEMN